MGGERGEGLAEVGGDLTWGSLSLGPQFGLRDAFWEHLSHPSPISETAGSQVTGSLSTPDWIPTGAKYPRE